MQSKSGKFQLRHLSLQSTLSDLQKTLEERIHLVPDAQRSKLLEGGERGEIVDVRMVLVEGIAMVGGKEERREEREEDRRWTRDKGRR